MSHQQFNGWRKSSASNGGGNCVEVGSSALAIGVRDTKDRAGGTLEFSASDWARFLAGVKSSGFTR